MAILSVFFSVFDHGVMMILDDDDDSGYDKVNRD